MVRERAFPAPLEWVCGCCGAALQLEHPGAVPPCSVPPSTPIGVCPCSLPGPGNAYLGNLTRGCSIGAGQSCTPRPGQLPAQGAPGSFGGAALPGPGLALQCRTVWGLCVLGDGCPVPIDAAPQCQCMDQSLITAVGKLLGCCLLTAFQPKLSQLSATALSAGCAQRWHRNLQLPLAPLSEALLFGVSGWGCRRCSHSPVLPDSPRTVAAGSELCMAPAPSQPPQQGL